jgi:hypothetical protein
LNKSHGGNFRIFDCADLKIIDEDLCGIKIEKLHTCVGLQVEIMQKEGLGKKKSTTF